MAEDREIQEVKLTVRSLESSTRALEIAVTEVKAILTERYTNMVNDIAELKCKDGERQCQIRGAKIEALEKLVWWALGLAGTAVVGILVQVTSLALKKVMA